jgi:hypothetical protein
LAIDFFSSLRLDGRVTIVLKEDDRYLTREGKWSDDFQDAATFPSIESAHAVSVLLELQHGLITLRFDSGEECTRPIELEETVKS